MSSDRFQQIERIYHSALEKDEHQRAAYLNEVCAGDEALRREVEGLLAYAGRADAFMAAPALDIAARALAARRAHRLEGRRLGAYEVLDLIGHGGMGEVYRALDTRLGRTVAIKILPEHLSTNAQARDRFEREARTTSALNHPHICSIYDVGEQDGVSYLVMEFIEGQTLAELLSNGPLPFEQASAFAVQMASALAAAHSRGIVHRDFKPGNVMMTAAAVKVLDFGLAKIESTPGADDSTVQELTQQGVILGTLHYMSPEQAEGREVDSRSDIFSFGLVLHEMLTGVKSFLRDSPASTISAVLRDDPPPLETFLPNVPSALKQLIGRCVRKDPARRAQSMADVRVLLEEIRLEAERGSSASDLPQAFRGFSGTGSRHLWAIATGALVLGVVTGVVAVRLRQSPTEERAIHYKIYPPEGAEFRRVLAGGMAVSPDGRHLVFVANRGTTGRLWVRTMNGLSARELPGTDDAHNPFWSADSRSVAFFASGKLKRVDLSGGPPLELCDVSSGLGGTWNADNTILFAPGTYTVLQRVPAAGGTPVSVTTLDAAAGERAHRWPQFLPGGRRFLYFVRSSDAGREGMYMGSLDRSTKIHVLKTASNALYSDALRKYPGYLLWVRDSTLSAQRFDVQSGDLTGDIYSVADPVGHGYTSALSEFSVSSDGTVVYTGGPTNSQLTWMSRQGNAVGTVGNPAPYESFRISPDGKWLAAEKNQDIWLIDFERSTESRFTFGRNLAPVWSRDGQWIAYRGIRSGAYNLFRKHTGGVAEEERLTETTKIQGPDDWSPDGRGLLFSEESTNNDWSIWLLPMISGARPDPVVSTRFSEWHGQFSPDGNWIAYSSNESGRREVYVQSYPTRTFKRQISNSGGDFPRWARTGELVYLARDGVLTSVVVQPGAGALAFSAPKILFQISYRGFGNFANTYDVDRDGKRFLVLAPVEESASTSLRVIVNWQEYLRK
jgi:eukaryotic-like serine/threonine-protein kinase